MSDTPHTPLPKLRTFQLDQAHVRGEAPIVPQDKDTPAKETPLARAPKIIVTAKPVDAASTTTPATPPVPPAFHELKNHTHKKIEHIIAEETAPAAKTVTVRDKGPAPLPRSFTSEATVITAAKKNEFNFFAETAAALKEWFRGLGSKQQTPKYTVSTLERRKGVIQKATTKSGTTFTTDIDTLKEEISKKREQSSKEPQPLHLTWSLQTEPGFSLIEASPRPAALTAKQPVTISYKKHAIPAPEIIEPAKPVEEPKRVFVPQEPEVATQRWEDTVPKPTAPTFTPPTPAAPKPPVSPFVFRVPEPIAPLATRDIPTPPAPPIATPPAQPVATLQPLTKPRTSIPHKPNPNTSYLRNGLRQIFRFDTTVATVVAVGSIISFVMVFLIVKTFIQIISPTAPTEETVISLAQPLIAGGTVTDVAISSLSKEALVAALAAQDRPATGVTEFRILYASGETVTGSQLWDVLAVSSDPNLSRSITEARLGYAAGEHVIILKVTDTLTVFGALLRWEPRMAAELSTLFELERTEVTPFTDMTIGDSDIRVMTLGDDEIIVYGFLDKHTVIITESVEAYKAALESI